MYVHRSNRMESLVDVLAEVVARPLTTPTDAECIVVQGKGMERWLSMELAQRLRVWANPDFPFPRKVVERAIVAVLGTEAAPAACFEPETMLWSIVDLLPACLDVPAFAPIRSYLHDDSESPSTAPDERPERATRLVQLAERIAATFDQYVVYRPQMVLEWERGAEAHWQAELWRALIRRHGSHHVAARTAAFLQAIRRREAAPAAFPSRLSVFGISTLPPLYLELLVALSRLVELHLFVLSPSREYWGNIQSRREVLRTLAQQPIEEETIDAALHLDEGHPLLASLGRVGRDFQQILETAGDYQEDDVDLYCDPGTGGTLAALQSDMLNLRHHGGEELEAAPPARHDDGSIRIHACHGPMREVEVLHDQLAALFDADPTLQPHDVVVMSPAIDTYAPFIEAVFGGERTGRPRIPFRIADRRVRTVDAVADAFARLLDVLHGRVSAPEMLDLLANDVVRERFEIAAEELDTVRIWVTESGIRWGVDAAHRAAVDQPALETNTWRFGLDRLLLGYAMPGNNNTLYEGVLPYDDVEGTTATLLGRFASFCTTVFDSRQRLRAARTLDRWCTDLGAVLDAMIVRTNWNAYQHQRIRGGLAALAERAAVAGFSRTVALDVVRAQLDAELERGAAAHGFLAGGVSFCALVPMRSIPFRVLCLVGMNDGAFPRSRRPLGFDLIAQHPRLGDRSARDDDRYVFLEALLSARQHLLITYVGQSIADNSEIPPSVVVSELLDTLNDSLRGDEGRSAPRGAQPRRDDSPALRRFVVRHPLQPFSPRYFDGRDDRLFSYAHGYGDGARALDRERRALPPFLSRPLPLEDSAPRVVTVDELTRFFEHPVRAFLQRRLQLYLGEDVDVVEEREPIELNALQQWQIGDGLLARACTGDDLSHAVDAVRASGVLPPGALGTSTFEELRPQVEEIARAAARWSAGARLEPIEIDFEIDATRVMGVLRDVWPHGQVRHQYSRLGGRHELGLWIRHVVLNCVARSGTPRESFLVGRPAYKRTGVAVRFRPLADPHTVIRELLQLYWRGHTLPLPLFPRASRAYVDARAATGVEARALSEAREAWLGDERFPGDCDDAYIRHVFGDRDPLDPSFQLFADGDDLPTFEHLAVAVLGRMLEHREEVA